MKEEIELKQIKSNTEREIIKLLMEKDQYMMGDILMKLKLGYQKGHKHLNKLLEKKWVSNTDKAPYYTLKINIK